jgi:hypothetical protein
LREVCCRLQVDKAHVKTTASCLCCHSRVRPRALGCSICIGLELVLHDLREFLLRSLVPFYYLAEGQFPLSVCIMSLLTSSTGVPRLISGPSSPIISAVFAASSETWSAGCASIFLERSLAPDVFASEYGRHCDGENRTAGRVGN